MGLYKKAYENHPRTIWAREATANYAWLYAHFDALNEEYKYRYGRDHASYIKLAEALSRVPMNMPQAEQTPIRLAMPDQYKSDDPIESYRNYCIHEKHYAKWEKGRDKPECRNFIRSSMKQSIILNEDSFRTFDNYVMKKIRVVCLGLMKSKEYTIDTK